MEMKTEKGKIIHHLKNLVVYESGKNAIKDYSIHVNLDDYNEKFWQFFSNVLVPEIHPTGAVPTFESDPRTRGGVISFSAGSVISLYDYLKKSNMQLDYQEATRLLQHIHLYVENLEKNNMGITCFDLSDFIVVNEEFFIFINEQKIVELNNQKLIIEEPIEKGEFLSPELLKMSSIPAKIHKNSTLYSMAEFVGTMLTGRKLVDSDVDTFIEEIYYTKLYWCLKGCLERNTQDRSYHMF